MARYIARRLLMAIPVLFVVTILIFGAVRVIPGDVCRLVLQSPDVTPDQCQRVYHDIGTDRPVVKQYLSWVGGILHGDFGKSNLTHRPVFGEIRRRANVTLELSILAGCFALALAIPMGVYAALKQDKLGDYITRFVTIGWLSMPSFWVGTMLITFPAKWWGYAPPVGYVNFWTDPLKNLQQVYLAAFSLGLALSATLARLMRSSMLEVLRQDYIRTARAKGLTDRVVLSRHAIKNAMLPVITLFGLQLGFLLGGTVVLESIFALPGLGTLLLDSVIRKDFTQLQGLVLFFSVIIIFINLAVDLSYAWFDPRIRYS
jgi:peptide/nickel transport system permease protein